MHIDAALVQTLLSEQFPQFAGLPTKPVSKQGHDNRTFRLGDDLCVRLPSDTPYADAVAKEAAALSLIKPCFSVNVPEVIAMGAPSQAYPMPFSIRRWIEGTPWEEVLVQDNKTLARQLGTLLRELRSIPIDQNLLAGKHSFYRGCHPSVYGDEVIKSLTLLNDPRQTQACLEIWQNGLLTAWPHDPVWCHGDLAVGNVLMTGEAITALIDFGTCAVGDPACDYAIAWTYFDVDARAVFRDAVEVDDGTWSRAKIWALWKALVSLTGLSAPDANGVQARALSEILREHAQ